MFHIYVRWVANGMGFVIVLLVALLAWLRV